MWAHNLKMYMITALLLSAAAASARVVTCSGTQLPVNDSEISLYTTFFQHFNDTSVTAKSSLSFETLAAISTVRSKGVDLGEALVVVRQIEAQLVTKSGETQTLDNIKTIWRERWEEVAQMNYLAGTQSATKGVAHYAEASSRLLRACTYYQLAEKFADNHTSPVAKSLFNKSVIAFEQGIALSRTPCKRVRMPFQNSMMHGYVCPALCVGVGGESGGSRGSTPCVAKATVLAHTGYDGSAEQTYHEVAHSARERGYNVLVFDGPGQGYTARFNGLTFTPKWGKVVDAALDFLTTYMPSWSGLPVVLWGRSFGGYLAPKAFADDNVEKRILA